MRRYLVTGVLAGWGLWLAFYAAAYAVEASETYWPKMLRDADLPDTIGTVLLVAALPVAAGGWLFVWGDGAQPPSWVTGIPFNVLVGLALYGALGVLAARHWGAIASLTSRALRGITPLFSKRDLVWIVVIIAIFAGWMVDRNWMSTKLSREKFQRAVKAVAMEKAKVNAARVQLEEEAGAE